MSFDFEISGAWVVVSAVAVLNIFVSFEFDRDQDLKDHFFRQAQTELEHRVRNCSLNEAYPTATWMAQARAAIGECDVVVILVGPDTHNAPGVETEVRLARELNKPVLQVIPQGRPYTGIAGADATVRWVWKRIRRELERL